MRWVGSLFALSVMMALVHHFTATGPLEARATLALGFLWMVAWLAGELAEHARQPRIVGYLIAGFCVGPGWLHLVRADELSALQLISDTALVLIAFAAGSELKLEALRAARAGLMRVAGGAMAAPFAGVALLVISVSPWFPLTVHLPFGNAVAIALVLGIIAAVSSPLATIAVMDELDSRGPFAHNVLAVNVAQTVVATVLVSLGLLVAFPLTRPGALNAGVVWIALLRGVGSLAAGVALGALVAQYRRLSRRDDALALVAFGFVAALAARALDVELILAGLAGGIYLANVSPIERAPLSRGGGTSSLVVSVTFFSLTGAGLDPGALADLWPWLVLLVGVRAVAIRYGVAWAGRSPDVTQALAREGWLGLISQAGVALALAPLVRRAFPASGVSLEALIVAMAAVHDVAGPICLRRALARAGELKKEEGHVGESALPDGPLGGVAGGGLRGRGDGSPAGGVFSLISAARAAGGTVSRGGSDTYPGVRGLSSQRLGHRFR